MFDFSDLKEGFIGFLTSRITILTVVILACGAGLIVRLFNLQLVHGSEYMNSFQLKIRKERVIPGARGNIYDRNGNLLAYNELANSVTIQDVFDDGRSHNANLNDTVNRMIDIIERNGDELDGGFHIRLNDSDEYEFDVTGTQQLRFLADVYGRSTIDKLKEKERNKTAPEIVSMLCTRFGVGSYRDPSDSSTFIPGEGYTKERVLKVLAIRYDMSLNSYQKYIDTTVATGVSDKTVADITENKADMPGVDIMESTARVYVDAKYFSSIMGYTGKISQEELEKLREENPDYAANDIIGKSGIEQTMETTLQGTKGSETLFVDKLGKVIESSDYVDPQSGQHVYLTLDKELHIAATDILESRLAGILVSKIQNVRPYQQTVEASKLIIPVYDVYYSIFRNSVVDITHFTADDAGPVEKAVYQKFLSRQALVLSTLKNELETNATPYNAMSTEYKVYESYIVTNLLYGRGIVGESDIGSDDAMYIAWHKDESISLKEYLEYLISRNLVNVAYLSADAEYMSSTDIYEALTVYIIDALEKDTEFSKRMYRYLVDDDVVTGTEVCELLLEQGKVTLGSEEQGLWERKGESAYTFIINRIRSLDITPAQLALDPCTGSMVITDVNTGDILALVSYPGYDNNRLANGVDAAYYAQLQSDLSRPLYNYATQQRTAPGSTFKMVTASAGMLEGVISPGSRFTCKGVFDLFTSNPPKCWVYPGAHGSLDVQGAIRHSCNAYFYNVGYTLALNSGKFSSEYGIERLAKYADLFGLSETTGIEISESEPLVSTDDVVRSAIGQGNANYTTVGLARYVTTVANGGDCYNLTLIDRVVDSDGELVYDNKAELRNRVEMGDSVWSAIHRGMRAVVEDKKYFKGIGVNVAGKTGTAQESTSRANHALFVSYAPYESPEISIATRIAYGYSSSYAAQITKDVYRYYFNPDERDEILNSFAQELENTEQSGD